MNVAHFINSLKFSIKNVKAESFKSELFILENLYRRWLRGKVCNI